MSYRFVSSLSTRRWNVKKALVFVSIFMLGSFGFAHGEDKAGPHGGYIQMPGAFHTELVPRGGDVVDIYLIDLHFQNATTKNSAVSVLWKGSDGQKKLVCQPNKVLAFRCQGVKIDGVGRLLVDATREAVKGNQVEYNMPLKLKESAQHSDH